MRLQKLKMCWEFEWRLLYRATRCTLQSSILILHGLQLAVYSRVKFLLHLHSIFSDSVISEHFTYQSRVLCLSVSQIWTFRRTFSASALSRWERSSSVACGKVERTFRWLSTRSRRPTLETRSPKHSTPDSSTTSLRSVCSLHELSPVRG